MIRDKKNLKAMTMVELLVASGIGVVLVGAALFFGTRFTQTTSLETIKQELNHKMNLAARQFEMDFSNAIKIKGSSKLFPAVFTEGLTSTSEFSPRIALRLNPKINDIVVMFLVHAKEFSAPLFEITKITCPASADAEDEEGAEVISNRLTRAAAQPRIDPSVVPTDCYQAKIPVSKVNAQGLEAGSSSPELIHQFNAQQFLNKALQQADLFLASNLNYSFLIKRVGYAPPASEEHLGTLTFKIWFVGASGAPIDFSFLRLQAVKRAIYQVDAAKNLMRKVSGFTDELALEQKLLENVNKFQADYFFADRRSVVFGADIDESGQIIPLKIPSEPRSAPVFDDEPRLSWTDLSAAKLSLEVFSKKTFEASGVGFAVVEGASMSAISDPMCKWLTLSGKSHLSCEKNFVTAGADFESLVVDYQSSSGGEDCLPGDVLSRCNSACNHVYVSPQRTAVNWKGYRTGSDYCVCKGNSNILPEGVDFSKPLFSGTGDNSHLNACIRAMASCDSNSGSWTQHDPRLYLACYGVKSELRDDLLSFDDNGNFESGGTPWAASGPLSSSWATFGVDLEALADETTNYPNLSGDELESKRKLSCRAWWRANVQAGAWKAVYANAYKKLCGCRFYDFDQTSGAPSQQIPRTQRDWDHICDPEQCPNLFGDDDQGIVGPPRVWQGSSLPSADAFSLDEATYCQCRATHTHSSASDDFRTIGSLGRPPGAYFGGLTEEKEATLDSLKVTLEFFDVLENSLRSVSDQNCSLSQCEARNIGCCLKAFGDGEMQEGFGVRTAFLSQQSGKVFNNVSWPAEHVTSRDQWSGYCRASCNVADASTTRRALLNLDPNGTADLPEWCQGPAVPSGGTPQE